MDQECLVGQTFGFMKKSIFSLDGKICVVTGGSGDLGRAISKTLLDQGGHVTIVGRTLAKLRTAYAELRTSSQLLDYAVCDVSDACAVQILANELAAKFGKIDVLVTAAGVQHRQPILEFTAKEWQRILNINLTGTFHCAQFFGQHMAAKRSGRIIMVTSLSAEIGIPNISAYAASRGGIKQLAKTMAVELAPLSVTVNCIGPGRITTQMTIDIQSDSAKYEDTMRVIPMKRWGTPSDIGGAAAFLASDAASYITGQSLYVDGGWLAAGGNLSG